MRLELGGAARLLLGAACLALASACASGPAPIAPKSPTAVPTTPPPPGAVAIWTAAPGEPVPAELAQALAQSLTLPTAGVALAPVGPLTRAGKLLQTARRAVLELRCAEALPALDEAAGQLRAEVPLPESRPLLADLYGLMLVCADRLSDAPHAEQASTALLALQVMLPSDVLLVLNRYMPPPLFGPSRAPVRVESDPPGAMVLRNLVPVGVTPILVAGGRPDEDTLDVEAPGLRKIHRPLGSGTELVLSLRPEDRPEVLVDRAAAQPLGSDEQGKVLAQLAGVSTAGPAALVSRRVVVVGPRQRAGQPVAGEALAARLYDLDQKRWLTPLQEISAGPEAGQAAQVVALAQAGAVPGAPGTPGALPAAALAATPGAKAEGPKKPDAKADGKDGKSKLPFAKTKWYTWVIAGGVAALIAGLLISEKVSSDKVTVSASKQ